MAEAQWSMPIFQPEIALWTKWNNWYWGCVKWSGYVYELIFSVLSSQCGSGFETYSMFCFLVISHLIVFWMMKYENVCALKLWNTPRGIMHIETVQGCYCSPRIGISGLHAVWKWIFLNLFNDFLSSTNVLSCNERTDGKIRRCRVYELKSNWTGEMGNDKIRMLLQILEMFCFPYVFLW